MGIRELFKMGGAKTSVPAIGGKGAQTGFFQNGRNALLNSWRPVLRESQAEVQSSWQEAAARTVDAVQNSGFLTKVVETETGSVVGSGLRFASRPDFKALGWTPEAAAEFARSFESGFRAWCDNPLECDAGGRMTFDKMQQAAFASYKCYGEVLALTPIIDRPGSITKSKIAMLPPHRLSQVSEDFENIIQGVRVDGWGYPTGYKIRTYDKLLGWQDQMFQARDLDGRPNVIHVFDASIATVRGISPMAPILKVVRQFDQYADATLTAALLQTIFAATIKTSMNGLAAFDGMMTQKDGSTVSLDGYAGATAEWYDIAKIDLTQHGRIAHLFPGEELDFKEAKQPGQQYDQFTGWLMREIAAGCGVTYESATGDYRNATYSSIRMAGAQEWLTVLRRRKNVIVPFCNVGKELWAEEAVLSGRLKVPGGIMAYYAQKDAILRGTWSGPAQPQADDFKAARSHQVLKEIGGTTLKDIAESYGRDWEDDAQQKAEENRQYEKLGLPLPHAPLTLMETKAGQDAELKATENAAQGERTKPGKKSASGGQTPGQRDPANAKDELNAELDAELGTELEAGLIDGD